MSFILSIFLCFALAFSGTAGFPAQPETATTVTVRNVTLTVDDESVTLNPQARITAAIGSEKTALRFEIENDGKTLMPVAAEITPDTLTFSLSDEGRAYTLSNEDFVRLADIDEDDMQVMEIFGDLLTSYGALIGAAYGNAEWAFTYNQVVLDALLETCGATFTPVEVELDGETIEAQQAEITLDLESCLRLMDALRDCGIEELETMFNSILALINLDMDVPYSSYAAIAAELLEDIDEEELELLSLPLTITAAETDALDYALVECAFTVEDEASMQMREEVISRGEETTIEMNMTMTESYGTSSSVLVSGQLLGPVIEPTELHLDYVMYMEAPIYYDTENGSDTSTAVIYMTLDGASEDGLESGKWVIDYEVDGSGGQMQMDYAERREDDGSVSAGIEVTFDADEHSYGISLDLNKAESAYTSFFEGAELFQIDENTMADDAEQIDPTTAALTADISRLGLDALLLSSDESLLAVAQLGASGYDDYGHYDYVYDVDDYLDVETLEEAREIYSGNLPDFTPPEGFEAVYINADVDYVDAEYSSGDISFNISFYDYLSDTHLYYFGGGFLAEIDGPVVWIEEDESGNIENASMLLDDGSVANFFFYGDFPLNEVEAIFAGLN